MSFISRSLHVENSVNNTVHMQVFLQGFYRFSYVFTEHVIFRVYKNLQSTGFMRNRDFSSLESILVARGANL
jgi:hypothetical protein